MSILLKGDTMKKILSVMLILVVIILTGCGKYSDETFLKESTFFVEKKEDIDDFIDGAGRGDNSEFDEDFLKQQLEEGRLKFSDKEVKIAVTGELRGGKIVEIKFMQGRYKNKIGYVFSEFIKDLERERELAKAEREAARIKQEKELAEQEKKLQEEKARIEQLADEGKISVIQDGVQIVCVMEGGNNAYRKLLGKSNLPEGMRLKIKIANVTKGVVVQQGGGMVALFERQLISAGEQNILIKLLDKSSQPVSVQAVDDNLIKKQGVGILDKEIYSGKINVQ